MPELEKHSPHPTWPEIKKFALSELDRKSVNLLEIPHTKIRRLFGLSVELIRHIPEWCWEDGDDPPLGCEDYLGDLRFRKIPN